VTSDPAASVVVGRHDLFPPLICPHISPSCFGLAWTWQWAEGHRSGTGQRGRERGSQVWNGLERERKGVTGLERAREGEKGGHRSGMGQRGSERNGGQ
jgi:hypothetical protein